MATYLCDDVIMKILERINLKDAIRCSLLSRDFQRSFQRLISDPSFLLRFSLSSSARNLKIINFSAYQPKIFTRGGRSAYSRFRIAVTLELQISVLACCNGVILLSPKPFRKYYVFNPFTGGVRSVAGLAEDNVGLAVDFGVESFHFKLVALDVNPGLFRFKIGVPSASGSKPGILWKYPVDFACESFTMMSDYNIRPVYAHGHMYWLEHNGRKTVAFDLEKERVEIIDGPVKEVNGIWFSRDAGKWFGLAGDSIQFVYLGAYGLVIHGLVKNEWRVKHHLTSHFPNLGLPILSDGRRLLLHSQHPAHEGSVWEYDIWTGSLEIGNGASYWADGKQVFFSYFPTLAKVSDGYLHKEETLRKKTGLRNSLLGLQQLLKLNIVED